MRLRKPSCTVAGTLVALSTRSRSCDHLWYQLGRYIYTERKGICNELAMIGKSQKVARLIFQEITATQFRGGAYRRLVADSADHAFQLGVSGGASRRLRYRRADSLVGRWYALDRGIGSRTAFPLTGELLWVRPSRHDLQVYGLTPQNALSRFDFDRWHR